MNCNWDGKGNKMYKSSKIKRWEKEILKLGEKKIVFIAFISIIVIITIVMIVSNININKSTKQIVIQKFDEWGSKDELYWPFGIAVAPNNKYLYVTNYGISDAEKYQLSDDPKQSWNLVRVLGGIGKEIGQFEQPSGMALDKDGNVYIADAVNGRIQKFDANGNYMMQINYATNGFWRPRNVIVAKNGDIYVANTGKWNIYRFNSKGIIMQPFKELYGEVFGLAMNPAGNLYVADSGCKSIIVLSPDLKILSKHKIDAWKNIEGDMPMLAMDSKQRIYAVSAHEQKIVVYDTTNPKFSLLGEIKNDVNNMPLFDNPIGIVIDSQDNVYVTERNRNTIIKLKPQFN
jgi:DNA-binding beta-propeller fold protein YncE